MSATLTFDLARYRNDLNRFVTELHADGALLLQEEMRLLMRDILRFTAPQSLAQGRKAVARSLRSVAAPLDPAKISWKRLADLAKKKDAAGIRALLSNVKSGFWGGRTLILGPGNIEKAHVKARDRYGRVNSDRRNAALLGDWRSYLKDVQSRVGYTKAGWWRTAQGVGLPLPSWVTRHQAYAPSGYEPPSKGNLNVTAINRGVKIPNYEERYVVPAVRARAKSLAAELKALLAGRGSRRASLPKQIT